MKKIKKMMSGLKKKNNSGEALILVIVAMALVMILGIALLFATYTAYMIRVTERKSETTFTSADTGMDLIRNKLTDVESKAAEAGYENLLNLYSNSKADEANFTNSFIDGLQHVGIRKTDNKIEYYTANAADYTAIFPAIGGSSTNKITKYNAKAIGSFLRAAKANTGSKDDTYSFGVANGSTVDWVIQDGEYTTDADNVNGDVVMAKDKSVLLKNLHLEYTGKDGFVTSITTDIRLNIPEVTDSSPVYGFQLNSLEEFNCIADRGLVSWEDNGTEQGSSTPGTDFQGSVYAGKIVMKNGMVSVPSNKRMIIGTTKDVNYRYGFGKYRDYDKSGTTTGEMTFTGTGAGVNVANGGVVWTRDINLKDGASITADGGSTINVADDLNFWGNTSSGCSATIKGSYIGFGNSLTDSDKSSSIIFNAGDSNKGKLDISGIENLILAGNSFVIENSDNEVGSNHIIMGSSITAKPEQKAYLIPSGIYDGFENPIEIQPGEDSRQIVADTKAKILDHINETGIYNLPKSLSEYGITSANNIKTLTWGKNGEQQKQYYFFDFGTQRTQANEYFRDYFSNNSSEISEYIKDYADISELDSSKINAAGTTINKSGNDYEVANATNNASDLDQTAVKKQTSYRRLSETLTETTDGTETPFFYYIDQDKLKEICGQDKSDTPKKINDGTPIPIAWIVDSNNDYKSSEKLKNRDLGFVVYGQTIRNDQTRSMEVIGTDHKESYEYNGVTYIIGAPKNARKATGYAVHGDFHVPASFSDGGETSFLVVDGDVYLDNSNFEGIILCSGTIHARKSHLKLNEDGVHVLEQTPIYRGSKSSTKTNSGDDWTLNKMVVYENWKKN